jgi:peptidoglycan lytic transglycosylase G
VVTDSNSSPGGGRQAAGRQRAKAQQKSAAAANDKPLAASASPNANGAGRTAFGASTARQRAAGGPADAPPAATEPSPGRASVSYSGAVPVAGEPYPPLSARLVNGIGTAPMDSNRIDPGRINPRSPRTALEPDTVDMPTPRSKSARHPLVIIGHSIISLLVLLAVVIGAALFVGREQFEAPGPLAQDRIVNIPRGSGLREIANVLTREGVIDQPWVFIAGVLVLKARENLKAGEYQFKAHASLHDVVATIVEGKVVMHQISIPEGLTSEQIVARLMDNDVLTGNIDSIPAEGSLLPDTYNFTRGVTREQMIRRMQQAQQRLVKELWAHRAPDLPLKTPEQLVILASMVEKETGQPDERTRIAAVFVNRLKHKMRLQSDPTIIYGLVGGKATLGRPIMKSEIDQPTPYNTYQIDGLPPGPITNPGRASLEAAANPARTRELYFVADGTGGHVFSETYEQHEKNVARLRLLEAGQKDPVAADSQVTPPPPQAAAAPAPVPKPRHKPKHRRRRR